MKCTYVAAIMVIVFAVPALAEIELDVFSSNEGTLWSACGLPIYFPMSGLNSSCSQWGFYLGEPYSCGSHHAESGYHCRNNVADLNYVTSPLVNILSSLYYDDYSESLDLAFYIMQPSGMGIYVKSRYGKTSPYLLALDIGVMTKIEDNWVPPDLQ